MNDAISAQTVRYITGIPRKPLPAGHVVVHNHVRPQPKLGLNGFRAWIAKPGEGESSYKIVRCTCGWAPELTEHYRVKLEGERA